MCTHPPSRPPPERASRPPAARSRPLKSNEPRARRRIDNLPWNPRRRAVESRLPETSGGPPALGGLSVPPREGEGAWQAGADAAGCDDVRAARFELRTCTAPVRTRLLRDDGEAHCNPDAASSAAGRRQAEVVARNRVDAKTGQLVHGGTA